MKKIIALALCLTMAIAMISCEKTPGKNDSTTSSTTASTTTSTTTSTTGSSNDDKKEPEIIESTEGNEMGLEIKDLFLEEIKKGTSASDILDKIQEKIELGGMIETVKEGNLNGFDGEIKGFKNGTGLFPMIGSIPFVTYIFETDNASALLDALNKQANPRWNICTEADAPVYAVYGNYVFFTMCPSMEDM